MSTNFAAKNTTGTNTNTFEQNHIEYMDLHLPGRYTERFAYVSCTEKIRTSKNAGNSANTTNGFFFYVNALHAPPNLSTSTPSFSLRVKGSYKLSLDSSFSTFPRPSFSSKSFAAVKANGFSYAMVTSPYASIDPHKVSFLGIPASIELSPRSRKAISSWKSKEAGFSFGSKAGQRSNYRCTQKTKRSHTYNKVDIDPINEKAHHYNTNDQKLHLDQHNAITQRDDSSEGENVGPCHHEPNVSQHIQSDYLHSNRKIVHNSDTVTPFHNEKEYFHSIRNPGEERMKYYFEDQDKMHQHSDYEKKQYPYHSTLGGKQLSRLMLTSFVSSESNVMKPRIIEMKGTMITCKREASFASPTPLAFVSHSYLAHLLQPSSSRRRSKENLLLYLTPPAMPSLSMHWTSFKNPLSSLNRLFSSHLFFSPSHIKALNTFRTSLDAHQRMAVVGGNWKCNGTLQKAQEVVSMLNNSPGNIDHIQVIIAPPAIHAAFVHSALQNNFSVALQDVSAMEEYGAFTGEITASMIKDFGLRWVITGHSERRTGFHEQQGESNELCAKKTKNAIKHGLNVIACIGEQLKDREVGKTMQVIGKQLEAFKNVLDEKQWNNVVLAYEPVWAIGTGKTATPEVAQNTHKEIREWVRENISPTVAENIRIIYGGSVKGKNAQQLYQQPDIDGFLVGGASLTSDFHAILIGSQTKE